MTPEAIELSGYVISTCNIWNYFLDYARFHKPPSFAFSYVFVVFTVKMSIPRKELLLSANIFATSPPHSTLRKQRPFVNEHRLDKK